MAGHGSGGNSTVFRADFSNARPRGILIHAGVGPLSWGCISLPFTRYAQLSGILEGLPKNNPDWWCKVEDGFVYVDSTKTILLKYIGIDTSIIISKSVTRIEKEAFISCKFTSISIPETVKSIRMGAFAFCRNLTSVSLPSRIDTISPYLFYDCGLKSVSIPNSVTTICENAFSLCNNLDSIVIPSSVKEIAPYTFNGCENLVFIDIPNSVTFIGNAAFYGCISMSTIIIPNSVTSIGNSAFGLVKNIVYQGSAKGSPWEALCVNGFVEDEFVYYDLSYRKFLYKNGTFYLYIYWGLCNLSNIR